MVAMAITVATVAMVVMEAVDVNPARLAQRQRRTDPYLQV
jgi:hypothetical protein